MNHATNKTAIDALTNIANGIPNPSKFAAGTLAALAPTVQEAEQGMPDLPAPVCTKPASGPLFSAEQMQAYARAALAQRAAVAELASDVVPMRNEDGDIVLFVRRAPDGKVLEILWKDATPTASTPPAPTYTTGHCENAKAKGGCQMPNVHCGWPKCDRKQVGTPPAPAEKGEPDHKAAFTNYAQQCAANGTVPVPYSQFKPAPAPSEPAPQGVPEGFVLMPMHPNREMIRVMEDGEWQWEDLLAAAEAITDEQYSELAAAPAPAATSGVEAVITAESLLRSVYTRPDLSEHGREQFFVEFMEGSDELSLCWGDFRMMAAVARRAALAPQSLPAASDASVRNLCLAVERHLDSLDAYESDLVPVNRTRGTTSALRKAIRALISKEEAK